MSLEEEETPGMAVDKNDYEHDAAEIDIKLNLPEMKLELLQKTRECQERGLLHSFKWLSEVLYSIRYVHGKFGNEICNVSIINYLSVINGKFMYVSGKSK